MHIVFETPRLILRQFNLEDIHLILELNSDPEVLKYVHEPVLQNLEQAQNVLTEIILPQYKKKLGRWAMHTKDDDEFIGWCGLKQLANSTDIDLGYRLKQTASGKGFATEAARHTIEYGFQTLKLHIITGKAHGDNAASIRILNKIGMQLKKMR